jgi:asparagine synthetase B (glutamine-hydrolysing)
MEEMGGRPRSTARWCTFTAMKGGISWCSMGVKPLFYYPTADGVLFGSEPKTILAHPTVEPRVNKDGFRELLVLAKNPESTIYTGMCEVRPGQVVRVNRNGLAKRRYWMARMFLMLDARSGLRESSSRRGRRGSGEPDRIPQHPC